MNPAKPSRCYIISTVRKLIIALIFLVPSAVQAQTTWQAALDQHRWIQAEPLLQAALLQGETPALLRGLATVYRATGRLAEAEAIFEKLLAREETADNIEDLARVKAARVQPGNTADLDRAAELYRRSLALRLGTNDDQLKSITAHQRLVQVLVTANKFPDAEMEAQTAISIRTRIQGPQNADLAADVAILARLYQAEKKLDDAATTWETVLRIQEAVFGVDDLKLAASLDNLSACRQGLGQWPQTEAALRRALAIHELNQGFQHPETAQTVDALAKFLYDRRKFEEAETLFRRSLAAWKSLLGEDNSLLATSYENLAVTEAALTKYDEAEKLYIVALGMRDADDMNSLRNLAVVEVELEKYKEAEPLYRRALATLDSPYTQNIDKLPNVLSEYAEVLRKLKRPLEATKLDTRRKALH
jgi:tetratricopeptide (TPR) repeat protein